METYFDEDTNLVVSWTPSNSSTQDKYKVEIVTYYYFILGSYSFQPQLINDFIHRLIIMKLKLLLVTVILYGQKKQKLLWKAFYQEEII